MSSTTWQAIQRDFASKSLPGLLSSLSRLGHVSLDAFDFIQICQSVIRSLDRASREVSRVRGVARYLIGPLLKCTSSFLNVFECASLHRVCRPWRKILSVSGSSPSSSDRRPVASQYMGNVTIRSLGLRKSIHTNYALAVIGDHILYEGDDYYSMMDPSSGCVVQRIPRQRGSIFICTQGHLLVEFKDQNFTSTFYITDTSDYKLHQIHSVHVKSELKVGVQLYASVAANRDLILVSHSHMVRMSTCSAVESNQWAPFSEYKMQCQCRHEPLPWYSVTQVVCHPQDPEKILLRLTEDEEEYMVVLDTNRREMIKCSCCWSLDATKSYTVSVGDQVTVLYCTNDIRVVSTQALFQAGVPVLVTPCRAVAYGPATYDVDGVVCIKQTLYVQRQGEVQLERVRVHYI
jgi:hypothetical protein